MPDRVHIAFERRITVLPTAAILPLRKVPELLKKTVKYKRIAKSVSEIGVIEPLVVARPKERSGKYMLLDGHMRYAVLLDQGKQEVRCLVADDDEAFTYNKRINRLATVQEHYMIVRALKRGVSEAKLARALDVDIGAIKQRKVLLNGIAPEVVDLLKDKSVNPAVFSVLRKMKPMRQIEIADLMASAGNFSSSYAKALLAATRQNDLVHSDRPKSVGGMTLEQMARMEREMDALQKDFRAVEASYGDDVLHLVIASGYISKLIGNRDIERYLSQNHPEILSEFKIIVTAASLDQSN